jgi:hypothetical protein
MKATTTILCSFTAGLIAEGESEAAKLTGLALVIVAGLMGVRIDRELLRVSRRTGEKSDRMIDRDYPHIVEMIVPANGFGKALDRMDEFHSRHGIQSQRGRTTMRNGSTYCIWCFAEHATAEAFNKTFGGVLVSGSSKE